MGGTVSMLAGATKKAAEAATDAANEASREEAAKKKIEIDTLMADLSSKLSTFETMAISRRGPSESKTEVDGGRSVMRMSEIRVQTSDGPEKQMKEAIASFIQLAQGGDKAKTAAVEGAEKMLSSGIDALFGVSAGTAMEKQGFVVMFLNYAFVRVDYYVYSYRVSGKRGGAESGTAGFCYFADLAVLKMDEMNSSEIDFLISQSLKATDTTERIKNLTEIKIQMAQSAVLSRILSNPNASLKKIAEATTAYVNTSQKIQQSFKALPDFEEEEEKKAKAVATNPN